MLGPDRVDLAQHQTKLMKLLPVKLLGHVQSAFGLNYSSSVPAPSSSPPQFPPCVSFPRLEPHLATTYNHADEPSFSSECLQEHF